MDVIDKIEAALRGAKHALVEAKRRPGTTDTWEACDAAFHMIDNIDIARDVATLRSDLTRVTAERDALRDEVEAMRAVVEALVAGDRWYRYDGAFKDCNYCSAGVGPGESTSKMVHNDKCVMTALDALRARKVGV